MAKRPTIKNISAGYTSTTTLNDNFEALRDAFDNTLSRDGSIPNTMSADLDLNGNDITNVNVLTDASGNDLVQDARDAKVGAEAAKTAAEAAQTAAETAQTGAEAAYDSVQPYLNEIDVIGEDLLNGDFVAGSQYDFGFITETTSGTSGSPDGFIVSVFNNLDDIGTVAANDANITTVAGISANVTAVAGNEANITAVGSIAADVTSVAGISADVTSVAGNAADISAVAADATDIGVVAGLDTEIGALGAITADITTAAANTADITTVATDIANVNTVADNLASVNNFADQYRIGATDPTTSLDTGDLFYNTTAGALKVYTGTGWEQGVTAGSGFLPLTGGTLTGSLTLNADPSTNLQAATKQYVDTEISGLVDSAPATLDTLNELAAALGDDANFSTTVTNSIATKLPLAGGTMTGVITFDAAQTFPVESEVDAHLNTSGATSGQYLGWNGSDYAWSTVDLSTKLDLTGGTLTGTLNGTSATFSGDVSAANFNTTSDATLKTNIETLQGSLDKVKTLRGVSFDWKHTGVPDIGVIAQEVEEVLPELVNINDNGIKAVKYSNIVGVLIEAIKEQQVQIDALKERLGD